MMDAVDTPESWQIKHVPDPEWLELHTETTETDPKWVALSPGGDQITVRRDLQTDSYEVRYECATDTFAEPVEIVVDTKQQAIDLTESLVEAVVYEGAIGVESALAEFDRGHVLQ